MRVIIFGIQIFPLKTCSENIFKRDKRIHVYCTVVKCNVHYLECDKLFIKISENFFLGFYMKIFWQKRHKLWLYMYLSLWPWCGRKVQGRLWDEFFIAMGFRFVHLFIYSERMTCNFFFDELVISEALILFLVHCRCSASRLPVCTTHPVPWPSSWRRPRESRLSSAPIQTVWFKWEGLKL